MLYILFVSVIIAQGKLYSLIISGLLNKLINSLYTALKNTSSIEITCVYMYKYINRTILSGTHKKTALLTSSLSVKSGVHKYIRNEYSYKDNSL